MHPRLFGAFPGMAPALGGEAGNQEALPEPTLTLMGAPLFCKLQNPERPRADPAAICFHERQQQTLIRSFDPVSRYLLVRSEASRAS